MSASQNWLRKAQIEDDCEWRDFNVVRYDGRPNRPSGGVFRTSMVGRSRSGCLESADHDDPKKRKLAVAYRHCRSDLGHRYWGFARGQLVIEDRIRELAPMMAMVASAYFGFLFVITCQLGFSAPLPQMIWYKSLPIQEWRIALGVTMGMVVFLWVIRHSRSFRPIGSPINLCWQSSRSGSLAWRLTN